MRIAILDPLNEKGHKLFNEMMTGYLVEVFGKDNLISTKIESIESLKVKRGDPLFVRICKKVVYRLKQIQYLRYATTQCKMKGIDIIILLAADNVAIAFCQLKAHKTHLFFHNNIDESENSILKKLFLKNALNKIKPIVFEEYIQCYLNMKYNVKALYVPHPIKYNMKSEFKNRKRKLSVFFPSTKYSENIEAKLKGGGLCKNEKYQFYIKGRNNKKTGNITIKKHYKNYYSILERCDLVFVGGEYDHRVSCVAYEALSFGKKLVISKCLFAEQLKKKYPYSVRVANDMKDLESILEECEFEKEILFRRAECKSFRKEHSDQNIRKHLRFLIKEG